MNEETMRKHYERTPKDILINILISSREEVEKLQNRNKECKREIERLNKKIEQYENPEDMTLMFMWCNEKARDEIKRLNNIINKFDKWLDEESEKTILSTGHLTCLMMCKSKLQELKGSESNDRQK